MSTVIQLKRSETASDSPNVGDLAVGELALNLADKLFYSKDSAGNIINMGGAGQPVTFPEEYYFSEDFDLGGLTAASSDPYDFGSLTTAGTTYNMGDVYTPTQVQIQTTAISNNSDGVAGEMRFGFNNGNPILYVCTSTNTWLAVDLSSISSATFNHS